MSKTAEDVHDWTSCAYDMLDRLPGPFARLARDRVWEVADAVTDASTPDECANAYESVTGIMRGLYLTTERIADAVAVVVRDYIDDGVAHEYGFTTPAEHVAYARDVLSLPGEHVIGAMPVEYDGTASDIAFVTILAATDDMITAALNR